MLSNVRNAVHQGVVPCIPRDREATIRIRPGERIEITVAPPATDTPESTTPNPPETAS